MKKKSTLFQLGLFFAFVFLLVFAANSDMMAQTTHTVGVGNYSFSPSSLTIEQGDTVIWTNSEGEHNVNGTTLQFPSNPASFGNNVGEDWTYEFVFTVAGEYDYQCDPHVAQGMTGSITVTEKVVEPQELTLQLMNMTPHLGQTLWLAVIEQESGDEVARLKTMVETADFSVDTTCLLPGNTYQIDFFADHNGNGQYDAPTTDHAWRILLEDVEAKDTTVQFEHNTNFTDIEWKYKFTLDVQSIGPHAGQELTLFVRNTDPVVYEDTVHLDVIPTAPFEIASYAIVPGESYTIDFFADHNDNGQYDAPPTDHAWRLDLEDVTGDTTLVFEHNTDFTNILSVTSLPGQELSLEFQVYPNPVTDNLYIRYGEPLQHDLVVKLFTSTGALVFEDAVPTGRDASVHPVSSLPRGVYFLELSGSGGSTLLQIVK